jgi:hypothetical protein
MKKLTLISALVILFFTNCKTSQTVTDKVEQKNCKLCKVYFNQGNQNFWQYMVEEGLVKRFLLEPLMKRLCRFLDY